MKRYLLTVLFSLSVAGISVSAPPEPDEGDRNLTIEEEGERPEPAEVPETPMPMDGVLDELRDANVLDPATLRDLERKIKKLELKYKGIEKVLQGIDEGSEIDELILGGDSIFIRLNNDSSFSFRYSESPEIVGGPQNDIIRIGNKIVVEEGEVIEGDIIAAFGDVIVNGTVEGGVIAFSGDIYVSSTGNVENGVLAISGKVKQEPGSRVGSVTWGSHYKTDFSDRERSVFRIMGQVLLVIYLVWIILTATCASLLKANVKTVVQYIQENGILKSLFMGYLAYCLALVIFIGLCITILGLPLALLGVPLALLAAAVLSSAALNNLFGTKILNAEGYTFRAHFYGSLFSGIVPGLFFIVLSITGNLVIMIFSWIVIAIFLFIIIPVGLGAVLSTRFGTRIRKKPLPQAEAE